MREWWRALDRQTQLVFGLAVGFVAFRTIVASLSGFGFHQGWNEGHYALIASGFFKHPIVPRYGSRFVYNVPPLFPYTIAASFLAFGESVLSARLPSILATGGLIIATYELGRTVYEDRSVALTGAVILATLPYLQLFGGRVQTDALMVFLLTASLTAIVRGYERQTDHRRWLVAAGALFAAAFATKQPAVLLAGVVFCWLVGNRRFDRETIERTGVLTAASVMFLLPVAAWFYVNYLAAPEAFIADWRHELLKRTSLFANVRLLAAIAFGVGITPPVLVAAAVGVADDVRETVRALRRHVTDEPGLSVLAWWVVFFSAFVLARTPHGHQYYAVVLAPPIALFAADGVHSTAGRLDDVRAYSEGVIRVGLVVILVASTITGTIVLFELSGEFSANEGGGTQVAADAGSYVATEVPDNATVLVSNGYDPPIRWYVKNQLPFDQLETYRVDSLTEQRLRNVSESSNGPVYLVYPEPAWNNLTTARLTRVYETNRYEYTLMSAIGSHIDTDSKFTFYLNDRQLVVYRVETTG